MDYGGGREIDDFADACLADAHAEVGILGTVEDASVKQSDFLKHAAADKLGSSDDIEGGEGENRDFVGGYKVGREMQQRTRLLE